MNKQLNCDTTIIVQLVANTLYLLKCWAYNAQNPLASVSRI